MFQDVLKPPPTPSRIFPMIILNGIRVSNIHTVTVMVMMLMMMTLMMMMMMMILILISVFNVS